MATPVAVRNIVEQAELLFEQGDLVAASQLLSSGIADCPSAILWNDWAAVEASLGNLEDAERGFRAALHLDPAFTEAVENLGALLMARGRPAEAVPLLKRSLIGASAQKRAVIEDILLRSNLPASAEPSISGNIGSAFPSLYPLPHYPPAAPSKPWDASLSYGDWCGSVFKRPIPVPSVRVCTSWPEDSEWGLRAFTALAQLESEFSGKLLAEIRDQGIPGDIAEFGIFEGRWINFFFQATESLGLRRRIYGFDSFEGLSDPHPEHDEAYWKKGQYACSFEEVSRNVLAPARPRIKLIKGFFEKSLRTAEALVAEKFAYVRIDCDIYLPALDCLHYLGPRLVDGAILVFDDWPHIRGYGEQRAFEEWLPTVPHLEFEFLFYGSIGHFYLRVHHKK